MKRAQGLPITTIIVAALGILVLVVIGAIFGGQISVFGKAAKECPGTCAKLNAPSDIGQYGGFDLFFAKRDRGVCDADFETRVTGSWIPKGMPKKASLKEWKCDSCCVSTG